MPLCVCRKVGDMLPYDSAFKVKVHRKVVGQKVHYGIFLEPQKNSSKERFLSGIFQLKQLFGMVTKTHIQVIKIKQNILLPFIVMLPNDKFKLLVVITLHLGKTHVCNIFTRCNYIYCNDTE